MPARRGLDNPFTGNPRGVKRNQECFIALEQRRLKAARSHNECVHQSEVARRVGVHRQSVGRWARQLKKAGRAGLKKAGRAGRKSTLARERSAGSKWSNF